MDRTRQVADSKSEAAPRKFPSFFGSFSVAGSKPGSVQHKCQSSSGWPLAADLTLYLALQMYLSFFGS